MSESTVPGSPSHGWVTRAAGLLLIHPPAGMPGGAWRNLEQELLLHAEATTEDDTLAVPVSQAHQLQDILGRPWPAGRWPWEWDDAANAAAADARETHTALARVLNAPTPSGSEVEALMSRIAHAGFDRPLLPSQQGAVAQLVRSGGGGNFSVPGSGKTTMTFAVYVAMRDAGVVDRMLVVAPQSAYEAWAEEAHDCFQPDRRPTVEITPTSPRRSSEVVVVNYERAAQGATRAAIDGWSRGHKMLVVFDEAHRAKRGTLGEHGRGARDLAELATRRLVLTGTPMPNSRDDLEAVLDLAWPGHGAALARTTTQGASNSWVRITKDQLGLEPAEVSVIEVALDDDHRRVYEAVANGLVTRLDELRARPDLAGVAATRLIAAASNPALLLADETDRSLGWSLSSSPPDVPLPDLLDTFTQTVKPAKLLMAAAMAHEHAAREEKLLIWTNFLGNVEELTRLLEPLSPAVITGGTARDDATATTDRVRELAKFRHDRTCSVLIATPQTLGEGVSLHHTCQSQVHVDRTFNAGLYLQSLDRTHRVGMPEGTTARVAVLVARGTIDSAVDQALNRKLLLMEEQLNDPTLRRLAQPDTTSRALGRLELESLVKHIG